MNLTIIIPLYNEADLICVTLDRLMSISLPSFIKRWEIIVVDDFSSDGSYERVIDHAQSHKIIRVLRHDTNMGKGAAVRTVGGVGVDLERDALCLSQARELLP